MFNYVLHFLMERDSLLDSSNISSSKFAVSITRVSVPVVQLCISETGGAAERRWSTS